MEIKALKTFAAGRYGAKAGNSLTVPDGIAEQLIRARIAAHAEAPNAGQTTGKQTAEKPTPKRRTKKS